MKFSNQRKSVQLAKINGGNKEVKVINDIQSFHWENMQGKSKVSNSVTPHSSMVEIKAWSRSKDADHSTD